MFRAEKELQEETKGLTAKLTKLEAVTIQKFNVYNMRLCCENVVKCKCSENVKKSV